MAKKKAVEPKGEAALSPVELFGLAEVKKGQWVVLKVVVEGPTVLDKEILFDPEPKEDAFNNLKAALVRWRYGAAA